MSTTSSQTAATRRNARKGKKANVAAPPTPSTSASSDTSLSARVKDLYKKGYISCARPDHFEFKDGRVNMKKFKDILDNMPTAKDASCTCEIQACRHAWTYNYPGQRQTEFVVPGLLRKGVGICEEVPKLVEPVSYTLTSQQRKLLEQLYPNRIFITVNDGYHDHPVSHISNRINAWRMWDRVPVSDTITHVIDINGNPTANESVMRKRPDLKIHTICHVVTGKDRLRMLEKWGPQLAADGSTRWHDCYVRKCNLERLEIPFDQVKYVMSFHTLYYYGEKEVSDIMLLCPQAIMLACVHRHVGSHGEFYGGEHQWERHEQSIKQWNKHTGETYVHRNTDHWFEFGSLIVNKSNEPGAPALSWTTNMLNAEVFIIAITSVPYNIALSGNCRPNFGSENVGPAHKVLTHIRTAAEVAVSDKVAISGIEVNVPHRPGGGAYISEMEVFMAIPLDRYSEKAFNSFKNRCRLKAATMKDVPPTDIDAMILIAYWINYEPTFEARADIKRAHTSQIAGSLRGDLTAHAFTSAVGVAAGIITGSWKQDMAKCLTSLATKTTSLV